MVGNCNLPKWKPHHCYCTLQLSSLNNVRIAAKFCCSCIENPEREVGCAQKQQNSREQSFQYRKWHVINQSKTINLELWASWKIFDYSTQRQNERYWRSSISEVCESNHMEMLKKITILASVCQSPKPKSLLPAVQSSLFITIFCFHEQPLNSAWNKKCNLVIFICI